MGAEILHATDRDEVRAAAGCERMGGDIRRVKNEEGRAMMRYDLSQRVFEFTLFVGNLCREKDKLLSVPHTLS